MTHYQGSKRYVALAGEILRVTIVGTGSEGFSFPKGQRPKRPYIVTADRATRCGVAAGDVFCVGEDDLYSNPIEASKVAMEDEEKDPFDDDELDEDE